MLSAGSSVLEVSRELFEFQISWFYLVFIFLQLYLLLEGFLFHSIHYLTINPSYMAVVSICHAIAFGGLNFNRLCLNIQLAT